MPPAPIMRRAQRKQPVAASAVDSPSGGKQNAPAATGKRKRPTGGAGTVGGGGKRPAGGTGIMRTDPEAEGCAAKGTEPLDIQKAKVGRRGRQARTKPNSENVRDCTESHISWSHSQCEPHTVIAWGSATQLKR